MNQLTKLAIKAFVAYAIIHTMTGFTLSPAMLLLPVYIATGIAACITHTIVPFVFTEVIAVAVTVCNHWVKITLMCILYLTSNGFSTTANAMSAAFTAVVLDHAFGLQPALAYIAMICLLLALRSHLHDLMKMMDWLRRVVANNDQTVGTNNNRMYKLEQAVNNRAIMPPAAGTHPMCRRSQPKVVAE